jgi:hypothetical protein
VQEYKGADARAWCAQLGVTVPDDGVAEVYAYHISKPAISMDIPEDFQKREQFTQLADFISSNKYKRRVVSVILLPGEFAITMMGPTNTRLGGDLKLGQVCIPESIEEVSVEIEDQ